MSKKNSSVNLSSLINDREDLREIFLSFKNKLSRYKKKSYLIGVSGGPDSMALAALSKIYSLESNVKMYYTLVDHSIRKNSAKEAKQVKKLLKKHNINLRIFKNKKLIKKNVQAEARLVRYEIFSKICNKNNISYILTAHNLEDQVETFFIRLSRGSGLTGLSSMKQLTKLSRKIRLLRPLLEVKKQDLVKISKIVFGRYLKDPSNSNTKFLRTRIRNLKKPLQKSGISYDQIFKSINNLASSKNILEKYYTQVSKENIKKSKNLVILNLKKFKTFNEEVKIRLINISIKHLNRNYYNIRAKKVINLIKNLKKKSYTKSTLGGCILVKQGEKLLFKKEKKSHF